MFTKGSEETQSLLKKKLFLLTHILIRASLEAMTSCWKVSEYTRVCNMSQFPCTKNLDRVTVREYKWMDVIVCLCPYIKSVLLNQQQPDALPLSATPSSFIFFLCGCFFIIGGERDGRRWQKEKQLPLSIILQSLLLLWLTRSRVYSVLSWFDHTEAVTTEQTWTPPAHKKTFSEISKIICQSD